MLVAGVRPGGVVSEKSVPQGVLSPETPPAELMQAAMILPMVLICSTGTVVPTGTPVPGVVPVVVLANWEARVKAPASPAASPEAEPIAEGEVM